MALPYARNQLVRYLTGKVIENVSRQITEQQPPKQAPARTEAAESAPTSPELARLIDSINAAFAQTYEQIEALEARIEQVNGKFGRLERRWGWQAMAKVVVAVVVAFVLGILAWQLLHMAGLIV